MIIWIFKLEQKLSLRCWKTWLCLWIFALYKSNGFFSDALPFYSAGSWVSELSGSLKRMAKHAMVNCDYNYNLSKFFYLSCTTNWLLSKWRLVFRLSVAWNGREWNNNHIPNLLKLSHARIHANSNRLTGTESKVYSTVYVVVQCTECVCCETKVTMKQVSNNLNLGRSSITTTSVRNDNLEYLVILQTFNSFHYLPCYEMKNGPNLLIWDEFSVQFLYWNSTGNTPINYRSPIA